MKDFPGGLQIVLEICIDYKYNKLKVLTFVLTRGTGSTIAGRPYQARFPDIYGNVHTWDVARPYVISRYFNYSNGVDIHNQAHQSNIALEEDWVTQNPYFRLWTTVIAMTVTDLWYLHRSVKHT